MKLLLFLGLAGLAFWGAVTGIENLLNVDDLAECPKPSLTDPACASADAIVTVSGGDTTARVAEAIKLYNQGWSKKLVFSGAALDTTGPSNAEAMRTQALNMGVPSSDILIESNSMDTAQNAFLTSALVGSVDRIIVVTSPYHQRRAGLEFKRFFGDQVEVVNHPTSHDRQWQTYWWSTASGWTLALSESLKTLFVMWVPR
jgi:uncharacterized SAM-binding protein YcdF (DUF218 family)